MNTFELDYSDEDRDGDEDPAVKASAAFTRFDAHTQTCRANCGRGELCRHGELLQQKWLTLELAL